MGKIIDKDYYRNEWIGQDTTDENLDKLINKSEKIISLYLNTTLTSADFDPDINLKDAVASQTEFMVLNGVSSTVYNEVQNNSVKLGKFSYNKGNSQSNNKVSSRKLSDLSYDYLVRSKYFSRRVCSYESIYGGVNHVY